LWLKIDNKQEISFCGGLAGAFSAMKKSLSSKSIFSLGRSRSSRRVGPDSDAAESDMDGLSEIEKARQDIMLAYLEAHASNDADAPAVERQKSFAEELRETYQEISESPLPLAEEPAKHLDVPDDTAALEQDVPEIPAIDIAEAVVGTDDADVSVADTADTTGYYLPCTAMLCGSQNHLTSEIMKQIVADDIAAHRKSLKKNRLS
jgi:hypothetical protein